MRVSECFDSNVVLDGYDPRDPRKQRIARKLIAAVAVDCNAFVSSQVLKEFAAVALKKLKLPPRQVREDLLSIRRTFEYVPDEPRAVLRALELHARYGVNFWDGLILAAAEAAGCKRVLSEDLNAGQTYGGVRVENPFA